MAHRGGGGGNEKPEQVASGQEQQSRPLGFPHKPHLLFPARDLSLANSGALATIRCDKQRAKRRAYVPCCATAWALVSSTPPPAVTLRTLNLGPLAPHRTLATVAASPHAELRSAKG